MEEKYEITIRKKENLFDCRGDYTLGYRYHEDIDVYTVYVDGKEYELDATEYSDISYDGGFGCFYMDYKLYEINNGEKVESKDKYLRIAVEEAAHKVRKVSKNHKHYNEERGIYTVTSYPENEAHTYVVEKSNKEEVPRIIEKKNVSVSVGGKGYVDGTLYVIEVGNEIYSFKIVKPDEKGIVKKTYYGITYISKDDLIHAHTYHDYLKREEGAKHHKYFELFQTLVNDYEQEHTIEEPIQYKK